MIPQRVSVNILNRCKTISVACCGLGGFYLSVASSSPPRKCWREELASATLDWTNDLRQVLRIISHYSIFNYGIEKTYYNLVPEPYIAKLLCKGYFYVCGSTPVQCKKRWKSLLFYKIYRFVTMVHWYDCRNFGLSRVKVRVTLRLTISQSVCLGIEPNLGQLTRVCFLLEISFIVLPSI
jgi:hypothetical protein